MSGFPRELLSYSCPPVPIAIADAPNHRPTTWLEYHAREHPDWVAAVVANYIDDDGADCDEWTYKQLNDAANRVAHFILSHGIRDQTVAFCMGRTLEAYSYQLGYVKISPFGQTDELVAYSNLGIAISRSKEIFPAVERNSS